MSVLDDARRLAEYPLGAWCGLGSDGCCIMCDSYLRDDGSGHAVDCLVLSLPTIVAALEAAERVVASNGKLSDGRISSCPFCGGGPMAGDPVFDQSHYTVCPMKALVAALKGEGVTA